jgi:hypothetical protein
LRRLAEAARSAGFREVSAIPKQLRAGIPLLTAFLIPPIRREGVMRTNLMFAVILLGCMVPLAKADEPGPVLPNPTVNIQQPPLARPMPTPRPRISRPDPPVKTAAVKKSSRPERRKSKRRPEKSKSRPVVVAKAKSPARRQSPAKVDKVEKAAPNEATSSVEASAPQKAPAPDHPLRKRPAATGTKEKQAAPKPAPEPNPAIELRKPALDQPEQQDIVPEQQTAPPASEPNPAVALRRPALDQPAQPGGAPEQQTAAPEQQTAAPEQQTATPEQQTAAPEQQTAAVTRQPTAEPQEERTLWWARQGSPAVARFRDCSAAFAARNVGKDAKATWADLLIRAAEGDCRVAFNDMANILTTRLGNDAQSVIQSLIETTFLPAARKAVASTQRVAGGKSDPVPAAPAPPK